MPREGRTGWLRRAAVLIAAAAAGIGWFPSAAFARGPLVSASPAPGAALAAAPGEVRLRFSHRTVVDDSHLGVWTAGGDRLADGDPDQPGPDEIRLRIRTSAPGDLTVAYHVVFADGASASGAYRFSVGTGLAPAALSSGAQAALARETARHVHRVDGVGATLLVIDGGVLLTVVALLLIRPRRGERGPATAWRYREESTTLP